MLYRRILPAFWLILWALQSVAQGVGPGQQFYPVHDFRNDWLVYDPAFKTYVPYIDEQHASLPAVSLFLDLESNRNYELLVSTGRDGYLFLDAALRRKLPAGTWQVLRIDSLYRVYRKPEVFLTLYGSPGVNDKQVFIGHRKSLTQKPVVLTETGLSMLPRRKTVFTDFFTLSLVFIAATYAFLFNFFQRAFQRLFSIQDLFSISVREESFLVNKPLSRVNLLFMAGLSFVMAFLYLFFQSKNIDIFSSRTLLLEGQTLTDLVLSFLKLSALSMVALLGKYLLISMVGALYRIEEITNLHFFKVLQASSIFYVLVGAVVTVAALNLPPNQPWVISWILIPFIAFYLGRLALLYLVILNRASIKNLYLFSYLCIVELIPLIIGVRFAL